MAISMTFRPLSNWPVKATAAHHRKQSRFDSTWSKTVDLLESELGHLRAKNVVIEADCDPSEIRIDGHLRANARLRGPGVVVSFDCEKGSLRFPCDTFTDWQANVRGIALALEALRAVDRYGVTQQAEQYRGWTALPDKTNETRTKRQIAAEWMIQKSFHLQIDDGTTVLELLNNDVLRREFYKKLAVVLHPDRRGDDAEFKLLQEHMNSFEQK